MKHIELISMKIISSVGTARSMYVDAIHFASKGEFVKANDYIKKGDEMFQQGQQSHAKLLQEEAAGVDMPMTLLLAHAEDQLMSAETLRILCDEFFGIHRTLLQLKGQEAKFNL